MNNETVGVYRETIEETEINITPQAREQLASLLAQAHDDDVEAIRIYVCGGGCDGMTYGMTLTDRRTKFDKTLTHDGFNVYVDAVALNYLKGVEIDFATRPTGASFVFSNVFATTGGAGVCSACGAAGGGCA